MTNLPLLEPSAVNAEATFVGCFKKSAIPAEGRMSDVCEGEFTGSKSNDGNKCLCDSLSDKVCEMGDLPLLPPLLPLPKLLPILLPTPLLRPRPTVLSKTRVL